MPVLPTPPSVADGASTADVVRWVADHLGDLTLEGPDGVAAGAFRGGQTAADAALASSTSPGTPAAAALCCRSPVEAPAGCRPTSGTG